MNWFEMTDADGGKHLINAESIMEMTYSADTNLTIISVNRAAYGSLYIRGNVIPEFRKIFSANNYFIGRIGE